MANYGHNMAKARERVRLNQREAAEKLGISQGYIAGIEIGRNKPETWVLLAKMSKVYGVTADHLLGSPLQETIRETNEILSRLSTERYKELMEIARLFLLLDSQEYRTEVMEDLIVGSTMFDRGRVVELLTAHRNGNVGDGLGVECLGLADQV